MSTDSVEGSPQSALDDGFDFLDEILDAIVVPPPAAEIGHDRDNDSAPPSAAVAEARGTQSLTEEDIDSMLDDAMPGPAGSTTSRLKRHRGGLFTEAEIAEIEQLANTPPVPISALPRTYSSLGDRHYPPRDNTYDGVRSTVHHDATKLCVVEIEALTLALGRIPDLKYVLYVGAAPGGHIACLAEMFPSLEFHLVDTATIEVARHYDSFPTIRSRIHVYREEFKTETAAGWRERAPQTVLISDISSGNNSQEVYDIEIEDILQAQRDWCLAGQFAASLLRFHLPKDAVKYRYFDGAILLPPFAPTTGAEGRLLVWGDAGGADIEYDVGRFTHRFYWLNSIAREWAAYEHQLSVYLVTGLCRCFDCARLVQVIGDYVNAFPDRFRSFSNGGARVAYLIGRVVAATEHRLCQPPHGGRIELVAAPAMPREPREPPNPPREPLRSKTSATTKPTISPLGSQSTLVNRPAQAVPMLSTPRSADATKIPGSAHVKPKISFTLPPASSFGRSAQK
jgi:hypothetical protein